MRTSPLSGAIRWSVPPLCHSGVSRPPASSVILRPRRCSSTLPPVCHSSLASRFRRSMRRLALWALLWGGSSGVPRARPKADISLLPRALLLSRLLCSLFALLPPVPAAAPNEVGSRRGRWLFNQVRPPRGIQDSGATAPNTRWGPDYQPISFPPPNAPPSARAGSLGGPGRPTPSPSPGSSMQGPAPCHLLSRGPMTLCSMS